MNLRLKRNRSRSSVTAAIVMCVSRRTAVTLVAKAAGTGLPTAGMLSFFFDAEQRLWSPEPEHRGAWQVTWFEPGTPLEPRSAPADLDPEARIHARSVSPALEWTLPPWDSSEMDRIGATVT